MIVPELKTFVDQGFSLENHDRKTSEMKDDDGSNQTDSDENDH